LLEPATCATEGHRPARRLGVDVRADAGLMRGTTIAIALTLALAQVPAWAQDGAPEQVKRGAEIYARNCSPCHGPRLIGEESAFDLRTFPHDHHARFVTSLTPGNRT